MILNIVLIGLSVGSIYALVALGYTMVYGIIRLINFAHGDFIMVGGYTLFYLMPVLMQYGMPPWLAVAGALVVCAVVGMAVELLAYRPVRRRGTGMSALITAIAVSLVMENLAQALFTGNKLTLTFDFFNMPAITVGGLRIESTTLVTIGISVVLMVGLTLFVKKTRMGRAMRAVSEDKTAAVVTGVNVNKTILTTFAIGAALASFAALAYCDNVNYVYPTIGATLGLKAFVAAVLGGIGSLPGAMVGGLVIGILESAVKAIPVVGNYSDAIVYLALIVVLLVRPAGLLGKNVREKV